MIGKLSDLGIRLAAAAFGLVPDRLWWRLCERGKGHSYSTAVLHTEGSFLIDPTTPCSLCGCPMSHRVYIALTDAYAALLVLETEEEDVW